MGSRSVLALAVALSGACARHPVENFTAVASDTVVLFQELRSYSPPSAVQAQLHGLLWTVEEQSSLPPGDSRPPFNILTLAITSFQDRGHTGDLRLEFFNARLMSVSFLPRDPEVYRSALGPFPSESLVGGELRGPNLRVSAALDFKGRHYFQWADERLAKQAERWLSAYS